MFATYPFSKLKRNFAGELLTDGLHRNLYSTAACMYQLFPKIVAIPRTKEDLLELIAFASSNNIPITPRGGASSLGGQAVGEGIVVDLLKYMNRILDIDPTGMRVRVEPGVILADLNRALKPYGLHFPPDPSSGDHCTIGGMLACNASGARGVIFGSTKDWVESIETVLPQGRAFTARSLKAQDAQSSTDEVYSGLYSILSKQADNICKLRPDVPKSSSGYNVFDVMKDGQFNIIPILVGSEGTLAVFTEATLKLRPLPPQRATLLLQFVEWGHISDVVGYLLSHGASAIEFLDSEYLKVLRQRYPFVNDYVSFVAQAALLVEFIGDDINRIQEDAEKYLRELRDDFRIVREGQVATLPEEQERLWFLRKAMTPIVNAVNGDKRPISFIEDVAVNTKHLYGFYAQVKEILQREGVSAFMVGHAGTGNLHPKPMLNLGDPRDLEKIERIASDVYRLAKELNGSMSGEHGDGLVRTPFIKGFFPEIYPLFREIKRIFDPYSLMNPGKIVTDTPEPITSNLRNVGDYKAHLINRGFKPLEWSIERCHGCGYCISFCPAFIISRDEKSLPRAKANLLRNILAGELDFKTAINTPDGHRTFDELCLNCHLCETLCPTHINGGQISSTVRAYYRPSIQKWALSHPTETSALASSLVPLSNYLFKSPTIRWAMELVTGISRHRLLQEFQKPPLHSYLEPSRPRPSDRKVLLFYGCFTDYADPEEGEMIKFVLEHQNINVDIPKQVCCGMPKVSNGRRKEALKDVHFNLDSLLPHVQEGYDVVTTNPTCAVTIKNVYPALVSTNETKLLADRTYDIFQYLNKLREEGALENDFKPVKMRVTYHSPCHERTLSSDEGPIRILAMIPKLEFVRLERDSCCGLAGTYGFKKQYFQHSMRVGSLLFDQIREIEPETVLTGCGTCIMQIQQGTGYHVESPIKILARSYGFKKG